MASTAAHLDDAESISCHCSSANNNLAEDRISLTLRPAASLPGNYSFVTNRDSLRRLLRRTDLPSTVLEKFEMGISSPKGASFPPSS
jgi:hypothetical protein